MAEQQNNNQPNNYKPTSGNTTGVNDSPIHSPRAERLYPLPPMTIGREQGIWPIKQTPEGIPHTADKE